MVGRGPQSGIAIVMLIGVSGCASAPPLEPDLTTYPRDVVKDEIAKVQLPFNYVSNLDMGHSSSQSRSEYQSDTVASPVLEFRKQVVGDTAEHKVLLSDRGAGTREDIDNAGMEVCGSEYKIISMEVFRKTDKISVVYRCPVDINPGRMPNGAGLLASARDMEDSEYFDVHEMTFVAPLDAVHNALTTTLENRGLTVSWEQQTGSTRLLETNVGRVGPIGFPRIERVVAILLPVEPRETRMTFQVFVYDLAVQGDKLKLVPQGRDDAYRHATELLSEVQATLNKPA